MVCVVSKELIFLACLLFTGTICVVAFGSTDNSLNAVVVDVDNSSYPVYNLPYPVFYKDAIIIGADGHDVNLVHNKDATNVSYAQVIQFIQQDTTDRIPYSHRKFMCGDYSERVHNNAEASGITCGFVFIDLIGSIDHAYNVFNTTDRGFVFVDCTRFDSTVDMIINEVYQPHSLDGEGVDPVEKIEDYQITW